MAEDLGDFRSVRTDVNGLSVHAVVSTGGKAHDDIPVVMVHGLGLSHRYMMPTAHCLARDFPVYVPDLPGFGDSAHPDRVLDMAGLSDGLAGWMDALGLERAAFLANSHGCQVLIDFAARRPERVIRGVIQGPTTNPAERTWLRQFVRWRQNGKYRARERARPSWPDYRKAGYARVLRTFQHALRDRPEDKAPRITAEMLVVRGEYDPICPEDWAEELAKLMPRGQIVLIPRVAHTLVKTAPEDLAAVTRQFLQQPAS